MDNNRPLLEKAGETFGYLQHFVEKRIDLFRLEMSERVIRILSVLITGFLLLSIVGMFTLFASIAISFYIGNSLGSTGSGFLIVAGAYGLLALLLYLFRRPLIVQPVLALIIGEFREELEEEAKEEAAVGEPQRQN